MSHFNDTLRVSHFCSDAAVSEDRVCVICCGSLANNDSIRRLPCGHDHWHESCVLQWLSKRRTCPVCRAEVVDACLDEELPRPVDSDTDDTGDEAEVALVLAAAALVSAERRLAEQRLAALVTLASARASARAWEEEILRALRSAARRAQMLGESWRAVDEQVSLIEVQLRDLREQLDSLQAARAAQRRAGACRRRRMQERRRPRRHVAPSPSETSLSRRRGVRPGPAHGHRLAPSAEDDSVEAPAQAVLRRLRGAVLHAPLPALEVFQGLAAPRGRLDEGEAVRVLRSLEAEIPSAVSARAFELLDANASGFVEESDWMTALRLPRVEPQIPQQQASPFF